MAPIGPHCWRCGCGGCNCCGGTSTQCAGSSAKGTSINYWVAGTASYRRGWGFYRGIADNRKLNGLHGPGGKVKLNTFLEAVASLWELLGETWWDNDRVNVNHTYIGKIQRYKNTILGWSSYYAYNNKIIS